MKTRLSFLLCLCLIMVALTACGTPNQSEPIVNVASEQQAPVDDGITSDESAANRSAPSIAAMPTGQAFIQASPAASMMAQQAIPPTPGAMQFENYGVNPFFDTEDDNLSTFAMDVDTASYTVARSYLRDTQQLPPADAIRPEEFVNYFDPEYDTPTGDDAFAIYLDAAPAPFGYDGHHLLRVGIQARYVPAEEREPVFLIFVIDVSGSMSAENRLGLVKESLALLVDQLREDDRVGIVVYSDRSRAVLNPTPASERDTIMTAINGLMTEGSTNAEDGLRLGYAMAQEYMEAGENVRIVLCSDGVANVGNTGPEAILQTIRAGVDEGVTLSAVGFGMGNYNDVLMEQLANDGNGNYAYVDHLREARRVFVNNLTGTLQVVGYDAKVQVEFNPDVTDRYRLIGYENRDIADQDFRNDAVDAGEVGAGHSVTALYEIALEEAATRPVSQSANGSDVIATVYIRYEDAETREVVEISRPITRDDLRASLEDTSASFRLQAAVAEFAELLRESTWADDGTYGAVLTLLQGVQEDLVDSPNQALRRDVDELVNLVEAAIRFGDR
ncbi:MAG: von Willebrand factor type A domain-containing protein [bacterium]|nr:von Willebrand factor type A domain-containing protein [bacterium]